MSLTVWEHNIAWPDFHFPAQPHFPIPENQFFVIEPQFRFSSLLMATSIQNLVPPFFCYKSSFPSLSSPIAIFQRGRSRNARKMLRVCRAMVEKTVQGASSTFAKDMERLSAKESLLLAVSPSIFFILSY